MIVNASKPEARKHKKTKKPKHVSGFVTVLGRPNAGKSTLVNALVGQKVAIVSAKPQTTRASIQAVLTLPDAQIVFMDTPGVHTADKLIHKLMVETRNESLADRNLLLGGVSSAGPSDPADL